MKPCSPKYLFFGTLSKLNFQHW